MPAGPRPDRPAGVRSTRRRSPVRRKRRHRPVVPASVRPKAYLPNPEHPGSGGARARRSDWPQGRPAPDSRCLADLGTTPTTLTIGYRVEIDGSEMRRHRDVAPGAFLGVGPIRRRVRVPTREAGASYPIRSRTRAWCGFATRSVSPAQAGQCRGNAVFRCAVIGPAHPILRQARRRGRAFHGIPAARDPCDHIAERAKHGLNRARADASLGHGEERVFQPFHRFLSPRRHILSTHKSADSTLVGQPTSPRNSGAAAGPGCRRTPSGPGLRSGRPRSAGRRLSPHVERGIRPAALLRRDQAMDDPGALVAHDDPGLPVRCGWVGLHRNADAVHAVAACEPAPGLPFRRAGAGP